MTQALIDRDATELVVQLRDKRISAAETARAFLEQIEQYNAAVNAIVSLRPGGEILAEAERMDRDGPAGPLYGLPIAIKDLEETAGLRTTFGSPIFADHIPEKDGLLAARLRAAGALVIGKTNTPEFGLGSHSYNRVFSVTRNPYDLSRSAGGSSGGAAAALAARMLPLADGSDMMGSLRNPAGWNNVYGFRPSYGLVPANPVGDVFLHQLATAGPMARAPADMALLLGVIGRPDPRLPHTAPAFEGMTEPHPMRIGWVGDWNGYYPFEDGITALCESALRILAGQGHDVRRVTPAFAPEALWESWTTLRSWAVAMKLRPHYENAGERALLKPEAIWEIERGLAFSAAELHTASVIRSEWFAAVAGMTDVDVLALPSAQMFAFDAGLHWPETLAGRAMDSYHRWMEVVVPASLIGLPALSIPVGFGTNGLPMGMQLIGHRGADSALFVAAAASAAFFLPADPAPAEELKAAHFMPPMHPMDRGVMTPLADELNAATDGALTIRIYPSGELGKGPVQQYKRVVTGVADIAFGIPAYTPTQFNKTVMIHMPGLFSSGEAATHALWDNMDAIADEYAEAKLLGLWANNPSVLLSREKPVRTLADIQGMKIRTPNPVMAEVVKAWGGIPVSMPTPEIYNAMNTGVIDAVIIGPSGIRSYKLNEIAKHATINIPSAVDSFYLLMNRRSWDALSDEHKAKLEALTGRDLSLRGAKAFYDAGQAGIQLARDSDVNIIEIDEAADAELRAAMADALTALIDKTSAETGVDAHAIVAGFAGQ